MNRLIDADRADFLDRRRLNSTRIDADFYLRTVEEALASGGIRLEDTKTIRRKVYFSLVQQGTHLPA